MKFINFKRFMVLFCTAALVISCVGCGKTDKETSDDSVITMEEILDGLNVDELITELADYTDLEYELTNDYTVSEEHVNDSMEYILSQVSTYLEIKRDVIKDGDYLLVDYTGYLDGEAFDGGAATDQYILISEDNGYIPGFTDGLVGKKVGETVTNDVTFPDPYVNNPDLSGKVTQFEFVIKGIYEQKSLSLATVTDQDIVDNYSQYNVSTVEEFKNLVREQAEYQADYYRRSEISDFIVNYLVDNSEVTIPEDYLEKRIQEAAENGTGGDEAALKESVSASIKQEIIILKVSLDLGIFINEDEYNLAVTNLAAQNYLDSAEALYLSIGKEDARKGEIQIRRWYLMNEAINKLVDKVKVKEPSSANS